MVKAQSLYKHKNAYRAPIHTALIGTRDSQNNIYIQTQIKARLLAFGFFMVSRAMNDESVYVLMWWLKQFAKLKKENTSNPIIINTDEASKERLSWLHTKLTLLKKKQAELIEEWKHEKSLTYKLHISFVIPSV
ncbi:hypothetical protein CTI12_AA538710 [Artemisia annua]|uniref:Uncharacterized protein n=1 Tax=Artemisia annua TaxID=35608 RepID=A0A2U1L2D8_ARTAN|nr:hypothetical protein CTI12_AA538710 [Artemisia annua]